jgi:hypothetical protein
VGKSGEKSNYILNMAQEGTLTAEQLKDMEVEVYYVLENFIDRYYREHLQIAPTIIVSHFVQLLQLLDGTSIFVTDLKKTHPMSYNSVLTIVCV